MTNSGVRTLVCFDVAMDNFIFKLFCQEVYANVEGIEVNTLNGLLVSLF